MSTSAVAATLAHESCFIAEPMFADGSPNVRYGVSQLAAMRERCWQTALAMRIGMTVTPTVPERRRHPAESSDSLVRSRSASLEMLAKRASGLRWNRRLFLALLEELCTDDIFVRLVGEPQRIPPRQYAQAVATALLLRHSWRTDDLLSIATQIGLLPETKRPGKVRASRRMPKPRPRLRR